MRGIGVVVTGLVKKTENGEISGAVRVPHGSEYWKGKGKVLVVLILDVIGVTCELPPDDKYASQTCVTLHVTRDPPQKTLEPGLRRLAALSLCSDLLKKFVNLKFVMCEDDNIGSRAGDHPTNQILNLLVDVADREVHLQVSAHLQNDYAAKKIQSEKRKTSKRNEEI